MCLLGSNVVLHYMPLLQACLTCCC